jgi:hypothetical protein
LSVIFQVGLLLFSFLKYRIDLFISFEYRKGNEKKQQLWVQTIGNICVGVCDSITGALRYCGYQIAKRVLMSTVAVPFVVLVDVREISSPFLVWIHCIAPPPFPRLS